jgi:hypothetical protein
MPITDSFTMKAFRTLTLFIVYTRGDKNRQHHTQQHERKIFFDHFAFIVLQN